MHFPTTIRLALLGMLLATQHVVLGDEPPSGLKPAERGLWFLLNRAYVPVEFDQDGFVLIVHCARNGAWIVLVDRTRDVCDAVDVSLAFHIDAPMVEHALRRIYLVDQPKLDGVTLRVDLLARAERRVASTAQKGVYGTARTAVGRRGNCERTLRPCPRASP